ncbi:MAG: LuxR family transcriptional regulator [Halomonadaceae bacterium]|nr:MAG: LuxR family transcriptional regulator [Halomonadaceae bacterium]
MTQLQEEQINGLMRISNEKTLMESMERIVRSLGFDYCAYGLRTPIPVTQPKIVTLNNYSNEWNRHYRSQDYFAIDPTIKHGIRSTLPIVWSDRVFANAGELWADARAAGLRVGWAQASRDHRGSAGLLTLARGGDPLTRSELQDKQPQLVWLAQVSHAALSRLLLPTLAPELEVALSPRETEVMRWSAAGKTAGETADILGISERTACFHIGNALCKLNCTNKTAAAVKAVSLGLLD